MNVPSSRSRHSTSSRVRAGCRSTCRRCATLAPRVLPGRVGRAREGGYERDPAPWALDGIPADFNAKLLPEDWPRFEPLMENAIVRVPDLADAEVVKLVNGPEAFTPDGEFILGPTDVRGFWVAGGFCAHGLAGAGGMGQLVAEWIVEDSRRSTPGRWTRAASAATTSGDLHARAHDRGVLDLLRRQVPGPRARGRDGRCRTSPTYARLQELGASFGEKSGWERANWFEPNAARGDESLRPRGWAGRHWSPAIGAEHLACRERRRSSTRPRSPRSRSRARARPAFLERLCDNQVARDVGAITYTQMLNPAAGSNAISRSRGSPRTASASSPARRSGGTTSPGSARTRPTTGA